MTDKYNLTELFKLADYSYNLDEDNCITDINNIIVLDKNNNPNLLVIDCNVELVQHNFIFPYQQYIIINKESQSIIYYFPICEKGQNSFFFNFPNIYLNTMTTVCGINYPEKIYVYQNNYIFQILSDEPSKNVLKIQKYVINDNYHIDKFSEIELSFPDDNKFNKIIKIKRVKDNIIFYDNVIYIININYNEYIEKIEGNILDIDLSTINPYYILIQKSNNIILYDILKLEQIQIIEVDNITPNSKFSIKNNILVRYEINEIKCYKIYQVYHLQKKEIEDDIDSLCNVCYLTLEEKNAIIPCGHTKTCLNCLNNLSNCAICRTPIQNIIKIYD